MESLFGIVIDLIEKKREGEYWDFKAEPHENNAKLLHDILSLSNCIHKGDRYIILGVTNPDSGCKVTGLIKGQSNRKSQANLIDFLRSKSFAGDYRPEVELRTILINDKEIDVIIVFDNPYKPYYITQDYRDRDITVCANYIFSRIGDTNTPINKSADLHRIEKMWTQRFGLDLTPNEKLWKLLLKPDEWYQDFGNKGYAYHKVFPEFRIELSDPIDMWEPYCEFYPNRKCYYGEALFKYYSSTLIETHYVLCDEMRVRIPAPNTMNVELEEDTEWFYYYNLDGFDGHFLQFLTRGIFDFTCRGSGAPFLVFESQDQVIEFKEYLEKNQKELSAIKLHYVPTPPKSKENTSISLEFLLKAEQMYDKWQLDH